MHLSLLARAAEQVVTKDSDSLAQIELSPVFVSTLVSLVIPVLVGLATKTSTRWKGALMIVLNAVNAVIVDNVMVQDGPSLITRQALIQAGLGVLTSLAIYLQVYKPLGITSSPVITADGAVVDGKLANVGVKSNTNEGDK